MSEDPIGFAGGDINLYRYVLNNPILFSDPSGKYIQVIIGIGRFIIGKIIGEEIGKVLPPSEEKEIEEWKKEEERKREWDKEGCGVIKSCEPEGPPRCPSK